MNSLESLNELILILCCFSFFQKVFDDHTSGKVGVPSTANHVVKKPRPANNLEKYKIKIPKNRHLGKTQDMSQNKTVSYTRLVLTHVLSFSKMSLFFGICFILNHVVGCDIVQVHQHATYNAMSP